MTLNKRKSNLELSQGSQKPEKYKLHQSEGRRFMAVQMWIPKRMAFGSNDTIHSRMKTACLDFLVPIRVKWVRL